MKLLYKIAFTLCILYCCSMSVMSQNINTDSISRASKDSVLEEDTYPIEYQIVETNNYSNQTVASNIYVFTTDDLNVTNVTVGNNGRLKLHSSGIVTLNPSFDVLLGGTLTIWHEKLSCSYDAAGNRIRRGRKK